MNSILDILFIVVFNFMFLILSFDAKKNGYSIWGSIMQSLLAMFCGVQIYIILCMFFTYSWIGAFMAVMMLSSLVCFVCLILFSVQKGEHKNKLWILHILEFFFITSILQYVPWGGIALIVMIITGISITMAFVTRKNISANIVWITNCCTVPLLIVQKYIESYFNLNYFMFFILNFFAIVYFIKRFFIPQKQKSTAEAGERAFRNVLIIDGVMLFFIIAVEVMWYLW